MTHFKSAVCLRLCRALPLLLSAGPAHALDWPGATPGRAESILLDGNVALSNGVIVCHWTSGGQILRPALVTSPFQGSPIDLSGSELFQLTLSNGRIIRASELKLLAPPTGRRLAAVPNAPVLAERSGGQTLVAHLAAPDGTLEVEWRALLRDGGNTIRQEFLFEAKKQPIALKQTVLIDVPAEHARMMGTVPGSPILLGNTFFAYEHPDSQSIISNRATCTLQFNIALDPKRPVLQSSVVGIVPPGQLRRGFLYYVERERAHPYRPFLHYNAWYDICWGNRKINEQECLDVVERFGRELIEKRDLPLASFVWDDGWDDPKTLWRPIDSNFPNGFKKILTAAQRYHSTLGFWLSPFGGYGQPKADRIAMGAAQGFETGPEGFSLAGTNYYSRFLETCTRFIDQDGANFFKFDGLARSVNETEAMLRLTRALRSRKPDLFISITTGTWPSPFWLWYGDSTWRGGGDMGFYGAGSKREQWITYRDMETYRNVVEAAPLYPINSLMTQGFAHARYGTALDVGSDPLEIRRELRSFFASGTCLQELYVTAEKMTPENWDDLAECARWGQSNADVLVDTHWIGGNPGKGQPYGWASWTKRKGILAMRNPSAQATSFTVEISKAMDLPPGAPQAYSLKSPWKNDAAPRMVTLKAGAPHTFELAPFEVLVFDALPAQP